MSVGPDGTYQRYQEQILPAPLQIGFGAGMGQAKDQWAAFLRAGVKMRMPIVPADVWAASTAYVTTNSIVAVGYLFVCTVSGTSGASVPRWPTAQGATVVDSGATWTNMGAVYVTPTDALDQIGVDSVLPRYLNESDFRYAARLRARFSTWTFAGTAQAILVQLAAAGYTFGAYGATILDQHGYTYYWDGLELQTYGNSLPAVMPQGLPWAASAWYSQNVYVLPTTNNGLVMQANNGGVSNSGAEPTWPSSPGGTVTDGAIIWTARALTWRSPFKYVTSWAPSASHNPGDCVVPVPLNGYWYRTDSGAPSGLSQPSWPTTPGLFVADASQHWECMGLTQWSRFVIIFESGWGGTPPASSSSEAQRIRAIIRQWQPEDATCMGIFISTAGFFWDTFYLAWGAGQTWGGTVTAWSP